MLGFADTDAGMAEVAGGKGANLGELSRIPGVSVPAGFCVTTAAFRRVMTATPELAGLLHQLDRVRPGDRDGIRAISVQIRELIEAADIPDGVATAITAQLQRNDETAWAVRSSATAEDLPGASFAGQHDSYLNVTGAQAVLEHIRRCWASLFTERAVAYRIRHQIGHRQAAMAVVVQQLVVPAAAGVMFTADPVTGDRRVVSVEAVFGLAEALVSGQVSPDVYTVRDGTVTGQALGVKETAASPALAGGTRTDPVEAGRQRAAVLAGEQILELAALGRQIEAHFGRPQDIEWCLAGGGFQVVQSRPVTTLFPVPDRDDDGRHVYVSVGHGQMMTDPMKPLGLSVWLATTPAPMHVAAGRLFVDVTARLAAPAGRAALLGAFGRGDPLMAGALQAVIDRPDLLPGPAADGPAPRPPGGPPSVIETDPAIAAGLIDRARQSVAAAGREIAGKTGPELLEFITADITELRRILFEPLSQQAIMAGMQATWWLNDHLAQWLGEASAADVLTRSAPGNITSQMGLDLLNVADVIRPYTGVVAFLEEHAGNDGFLDDPGLTALPGGEQARAAIAGYLDQYGMRCVGEIDITRPRWSEQPGALLPLILGNITSFEPGEAARRFERGEREAAEKEAGLLARLRELPDGEEKAAQTKEMIGRLRTFIGYREFPKYGMISRYFVYKRALLAEAGALAAAGVLADPEDIFFLSLDELGDVVRTGRADQKLIETRRSAFASYAALTPPRVLTSDGAAFSGSYASGGRPDGALAGLGVSAGVVEGRARVILDMAGAGIAAGDILVTPHTDPSWSPLFAAVAGLVTEVGGLMTHGAVVAREYGLPAVTGVARATELIADGQRIRLNGTAGYVELLDGS